jgi:hypothetical protein
MADLGGVRLAYACERDACNPGNGPSFKHSCASAHSIHFECSGAIVCALQRMERQIKARGVGVTEHAQRLFDQLSKTMPCKWQGTTIEVFDSVLIPSPYSISTCTFRDGAEENTTVMDRVQVW